MVILEFKCQITHTRDEPTPRITRRYAEIYFLETFDGRIGEHKVHGVYTAIEHDQVIVPNF
jgi:hypothetical protein